MLLDDDVTRSRNRNCRPPIRQRLRSAATPKACAPPLPATALAALIGLLMSAALGCRSSSSSPAPPPAERAMPQPASQPARPPASPPAATPTSAPAATPASAPAKGGDLLNLSESRTRTDYRLYLPASYRADRQWPMLVALHGLAPFDSPMAQANRWRQQADNRGWIVLAVSVGSSRLGGGEDAGSIAADVKAVNAVVNEVIGRWSVNPRLVFLAAFDSGVTPALASAIDRPTRFAAVALYRPFFEPRRLADRSRDKLKGLPVLVAWMASDPPGAVRDGPVLVDWLKAAGAAVEAATPQADRDPAVGADFFARRIGAR